MWSSSTRNALLHKNKNNKAADPKKVGGFTVIRFFGAAAYSKLSSSLRSPKSRMSVSISSSVSDTPFPIFS